jgi:hypothetical protein
MDERVEIRLAGGAAGEKAGEEDLEGVFLRHPDT